MNIQENIVKSFSNDNNGFSAKKLTAFLLAVTYCYCHRYVSEDNVVMVLTVDAGLITSLFVVNVADKFKNPTPNNEHIDNNNNEDT